MSLGPEWSLCESGYVSIGLGRVSTCRRPAVEVASLNRMAHGSFLPLDVGREEGLWEAASLED